MTTPDPISEALENVVLFHSVVKSLQSFDEIEVRGVIDTLIQPTEDEICLIATYRRAQLNVETLLSLQDIRHFQATAMLARAMFELAVDARLLQSIPNGWIKMKSFTDVDRLRAARKIVSFKNANQKTEIESRQCEAFISQMGQAIDHIQSVLWPKMRRVTHWSGLGLDQRVKRLGQPFEQIYEAEYPRLSWYVHSGLTGIVNLEPQTFAYLCSGAFKLAADAYWEILMTLIRRFKIAKANEKIEQKIEVARKLPFTENQDQVDALLQLMR